MTNINILSIVYAQIYLRLRLERFLLALWALRRELRRLRLRPPACGTVELVFVAAPVAALALLIALGGGAGAAAAGAIALIVVAVFLLLLALDGFAEDAPAPICSIYTQVLMFALLFILIDGWCCRR